jgi:hypothetical protein
MEIFMLLSLLARVGSIVLTEVQKGQAEEDGELILIRNLLNEAAEKLPNVADILSKYERGLLDFDDLIPTDLATLQEQIRQRYGRPQT